MNPCMFDTETALIRPALLAPPMTCLTFKRPGMEPRIEHVHDARQRIRSWLLDRSTLLVAHNTAFDAAVICAEFPDLIPFVFQAYRENRITCTKKRQQLLDIAGGVYRQHPDEKGKWVVHGYHLSDLSLRFRGVPMQKDGWRYEYARFRDVPLDRWVERAQEVQAWARQRRAELPPASVLAAVAKHPRDFGYETEAAWKAADQEIKNLDAIIADVPEGVIKYPLDDVVVAEDVFMAQEKHAHYLKDQYRQAYADFVLYLSSAWGLRTYAEGVEALRAELAEAHQELEAELQAAGLVRENGTRNMAAIKTAMIEACHVFSLPIPRTAGHDKPDEKGVKCSETVGDACTEHVSLDSDACEAVVHAAAIEGESDTVFEAYAEFAAITKMLNNDVAMLEKGTVYPVHTHYDLAETGRTTSSKPNIQNLNTGRIKNERSQAQRLRKGVRQAFVPRLGRVFAQADFPQLELYTLAQCCKTWLGFSALGDALNAGLDPHLAVAAKIVGISYEEAKANKKRHDVDHARQIGKVFNFGKPGGLGHKKLITFARKTYNVTLTLEQCEVYTKQWHETFPEMRAYFARVNALFGEDQERASVCTLWTERYRGGATYCAACNNGFQALGVDCAKRALCLVAEAEYVDTASPLYGSRTVAFVHDELIAETDDTPRAHDAAFELARLMVQGANEFLPDVPIPLAKMEPTLMRVWSKEAVQVFDSAGRLVPWSFPCGT